MTRVRKKNKECLSDTVSDHVSNDSQPSLSDVNILDQETKKVEEFYYERLDHYINQFGEKTALMMQIGSFYEIYETLDHVRGNCLAVSRIMDISCVERAKHGSYMAGVPINKFDKHTVKLLNNGYTVIRYDQLPVPNTKNKFYRGLGAILSPGTNIDSQQENNWLISIFIDFHDFTHRRVGMSIGYSIIDRTVSRQVITHESHDQHGVPGGSYDELVCILEQFPPSEIIIYTEKPNQGGRIVEKALGGSYCPVHVYRYTPGAFIEKGYDNLQLFENRAFQKLCTFLQEHFMTLHDPVVVPYLSNQSMIMTSTCIDQLDIPKIFHILDRTRTVMGKRLLGDRLRRPSCNTDVITAWHDVIEGIDKSQCVSLRDALSGIIDLSRCHQKMNLQRILPRTFVSCVLAYRKSICLHECLQHQFPLATIDSVKSLVTEIENVINVDDIKDDSFRYRIFVSGFSPDVDKLIKTIDKSTASISKLKKEIESEINAGECLKVSNLQKGFETTTIRAQIVEKNKNKFSVKIETVKHNKGSIITAPPLTKWLNESEDSFAYLELLQRETFNSVVSKLYTSHLRTLESIEDYIAQVDFFTNARVIADDYRYTRPSIVSSVDHNVMSTFSAIALRHPLIEKIHDDIRYIPNDVTLNKDTSGYVIYGMNAGGKTSCLKSVGVAVIMAQAGLYVPCDELKLVPFQRVMTRIAGGDSVMRGQSSFEVECEEMNSVLYRADKNTLVLGDEVCRGTEVDSAKRMVYAFTKVLHDRGVPFITATHIHDIAKKIQSDCPHIRVCHTHVQVMPCGDIIYHRKLLEGQGPSMYGLEVARALDFPKYFLDIARNFDNGKTSSSTNLTLLDSIEKVTDQFENMQIKVATLGKKTRKKRELTKTSKYNSRQVVESCQRCGYVQRGANAMPLDTHHLNAQCNAESGFHEHAHVHALHNLIVLCKPCHQSVHADKFRIDAVQTIKGTRYDFIDIIGKQVSDWVR